LEKQLFWIVVRSATVEGAIMPRLNPEEIAELALICAEVACKEQRALNGVAVEGVKIAGCVLVMAKGRDRHVVYKLLPGWESEDTLAQRIAEDWTHGYLPVGFVAWESMESKEAGFKYEIQTKVRLLEGVAERFSFGSVTFEQILKGAENYVRSQWREDVVFGDGQFRQSLINGFRNLIN
jgi:hypothetical protein